MKQKFHLEGVAILLLSCVFAACVMVVLSVGANAYSGVTERGSSVLDAGTAEQYLVAKLRHQDSVKTRPFVTDMDGNVVTTGPVLQYIEEDGGVDCLTAVYCQDGHVYELFTLADLGWQPGEGEYVLDVQSLSFEDTGRGIRTVLVTADGTVCDFYVGFRSQEGGCYEQE